MTMLKLAIKNLRSHTFISVLVCLQTTLLLVLSVFMISATLAKYNAYKIFGDYYEKDGCIFMPNGAFRINDEIINSQEKMSATLKNVDKMAFTYSLNITAEGMAIDSYCYDDDLLRHAPRLKSGVWLTEKNTTDKLQAVISENEQGIKTGDTITCTQYTFDGGTKDYEVEIIGEMVDYPTIIDIASGHDQGSIKYDYRFAFSNYDGESSGITTTDANGNQVKIFGTALLFRASDADRLGVEKGLHYLSFISFKDGTPQKTVDENLGIINGALEGGTSVTFKSIREKSMDYISVELYKILPIIICVLIITLLTTMCLAAISTYSQTRVYGIYYLCGLRWKSCAMINALAAFMNSLASIVLAALVFVVGNASGLLSSTVIEFGLPQIGFCLLIILISITVSVALPLFILTRVSPTSVMKES